jgi:hypothetical protein
LDSDSRVKKNRTPPWTRTPGSKPNRTPPWTRTPGSKANRTPPWTPSDSRVRARIGLLLGLGLLAYLGCGFGGRAPPPLSRPPDARSRACFSPPGFCCLPVSCSGAPKFSLWGVGPQNGRHVRSSRQVLIEPKSKSSAGGLHVLLIIMWPDATLAILLLLSFYSFY